MYYIEEDWKVKAWNNVYTDHYLYYLSTLTLYNNSKNADDR